ncbi:MAG: hypothetical protein NC338_00730 [Firmicutes bacterium]|nr:hypothetical protein [Bacillota bacterium]MCM1400477.1 hypothetical protein [Bacteroides sp.]MCM1477448.1 hypothetical protein [Bacteroides sp.]
MKQKIIFRTAMMLALILGLTAMTSCDDDEYYSTDYDILTAYNWELVAINGFPVSEIDVCEFEFYDFGNGLYGSYNSYGNWNTISINWELDYAPGGAQYLYVYPLDGYGQTWQYLMRLSGGYSPLLELNDLATGDRLTFQAY